MLSTAEIEAAKRNGLLFPVTSPNAWRSSPRAFLMCRNLRDDLEQGKIDQNEKARRRWAELEAAMIHFVHNGRMTKSLLKQLDPKNHEHWELISRRPKPSLRVFGRFYMPDIFIGTHVKVRSELGGKWSFQFQQEVLICEDHYRRSGLSSVFSDIPLFRYTAYITDNATEMVRIEK